MAVEADEERKHKNPRRELDIEFNNFLTRK